MTYIIGVVVVFLEFVSNGKHLAIFEVGGAFGQNTFGGTFNVGSQDTGCMRFVQL